jgi:hypothetical protein
MAAVQPLTFDVVARFPDGEITLTTVSTPLEIALAERRSPSTLSVDATISAPYLRRDTAQALHELVLKLSATGTPADSARLDDVAEALWEAYREDDTSSLPSWHDLRDEAEHEKWLDRAAQLLRVIGVLE